MTTYTMQHPSVFESRAPEHQLQELVDYVLEAEPSPQEIALFNNRLRMYARKAGISIEQARSNVYTATHNSVKSRVSKFSLGKG